MERPVIYHMADIHISNNTDRYEEYEKIFKKVYKMLEEEKSEKIIIIAGDLFDNKITLKTYSLRFGSLLISNLVRYGELILIDGNHDVNMTNSEVESTISSMLTLGRELNIKEMEKIHYLNENKIYNIKGINFGLTTMFTKKVTKIEDKKEDEIYVGLYHGKVYGAKTDLEYKIDENNCNYQINDFNDYDIICLGDIHKHQFINERIAYSSSLVQKDFGETVKNHGLIIWDLNKLEGKFKEIENEYCMINCKIEGKVLTLNEEINLEDYKYIKAKIIYKKEEKKDLEKLEEKLRRRYNFKEITMYEDIVLKDDEEINVKIDDDIKKVFDDFINKTENDKKEKDEMKRIIYEIIDKNDLEIERNMKKIELCSLSFSNLFCYGDNNEIDFSKLKNIVGIVADNGWGKSSIIDTLLYTIYQRCGRTKGTRVLNKFKKNSVSTLNFKINDTPYEIKRKINKLKNKNEEILEIKKNGKNINSDYKKNTNKMIEEIFGSYEDLTDNNIMLQNSNNFINKTEKEKKDTMYKIFGIEAYDKIYQIIKNRILELKKEIDKGKNKLLSYEEESKILEDIKIKNENLEKKNQEYEELCNKIIDQNYYSNKLKNIIGNQTDINLINKEYELCILDIKEINKEELNLKIIDEKYLERISEDIEEEREKLENLKNEITEKKVKKKNITKIMDINEKINIFEENKIKIENLNSEKIKILEIQLELEKTKKILIEYETSKKILENYKEENKYLLEHKFNKNCKECINNKKIHEKINYINKINELSEFIKENKDINEKIKKLESIILKEEEKKNLIKENKNINELIKIHNKNQEYEKINKKIEYEVNKLEKDYNFLKEENKRNINNFNELKLFIKKLNNLSGRKKDLEKIINNWKNNEKEIEELKRLIIDYDVNKNMKRENELEIKQIEKEIILLEKNVDINKKNKEEIKLVGEEINKYDKVNKLFSEEKLIDKLLNQIIDNREYRRHNK